MGRVSSSDFIDRKMSSTTHSCLYFTATSGAVNSALVVSNPLAVIARFLLDFLLVDGEAFPTGLQKPTITLVAHQRLVSALQGVPQRSHDGFALLPVSACLLLVATHDIALSCNPNLFHLQRRGIVGIVAFGKHFLIPSRPRHHLAGRVGTPHPHTQDVFPIPALEVTHRFRTDHPAVRHDAHLAHWKTRLESVYHRHQTFYIGRIARPQFTAHGVALVVQHHADYHLQPIRPMVFGVSVTSR